MARHEILRTTLHLIDGVTHQIVRPSRELTLARVDMSQAAASETEAQRWLAEESEHRFDLRRGRSCVRP